MSDVEPTRAYRVQKNEARPRDDPSNRNLEKNLFVEREKCAYPDFVGLIAVRTN